LIIRNGQPPVASGLGSTQGSEHGNKGAAISTSGEVVTRGDVKIILSRIRYRPDVAGKGIVKAVVTAEVAGVAEPRSNPPDAVEQAHRCSGIDMGEGGDQITYVGVGQVIEGDGDVGNGEAVGDDNSAGSTCGVVIGDVETSTSSGKADGAGGEDGQTSDRANCAGEDNTSQRERFEVSCSIHEQFWANFTNIFPPPPRFCQISLFYRFYRFLSM